MSMRSPDGFVKQNNGTEGDKNIVTLSLSGFQCKIFKITLTFVYIFLPFFQHAGTYNL